MTNGITQHLCAVDGGGTGCRAVIVRRDGTELARASGGPANYTTDPAQATQNVLATIQNAAAHLNEAIALRSLVTHVGIAGILGPQDARILRASLPFDTCSVSDDRETTTLGVLGARDGAVLAIGTGSFVAMRRGACLKYWGGWGFAAGDQASGAWLGHALLEHCIFVSEGLEPQTPLTQQILARFDDTPADMSTFAVQATPSDFAAFAPQVVAAARDGDPVGQMLMLRGADYLNKVLHAARITDLDAICLTGGVGPHYEPFLAPAFRTCLQPAEGVALDGALEFARKHLNAMETQA